MLPAQPLSSHGSLNPLPWAQAETFCKRFCTRQQKGAATSDYILSSRDNWTLPIEMLSVSLHISALLGKFLMGAASTVPPT